MGPGGRAALAPIPSSRALGGCLGPRARIPRRRAHCPDGRRLSGEPGMYGLSARATEMTNYQKCTGERRRLGGLRRRQPVVQSHRLLSSGSGPTKSEARSLPKQARVCKSGGGATRRNRFWGCRFGLFKSYEEGVLLHAHRTRRSLPAKGQGSSRSGRCDEACACCPHCPRRRWGLRQ